MGETQVLCKFRSLRNKSFMSKEQRLGRPKDLDWGEPEGKWEKA